MKHRFTFVVGVILLLVLLAYMFSFQVSYRQKAVVLTLGRAEEPAYLVRDGLALPDPDNPGSVRATEGLFFRWPWPIQSVQSLPTTLQIYDDTYTDFKTVDEYALTVQLFAVWRFVDPYQATVSGKTSTREAEQVIGEVLQRHRGIIGSYRFEQLVNQDPAQLRLEEAQQKLLEAVRADLQDPQDRTARYGVWVDHVGVRKLVMPQLSTEQVYERMRETRISMASDERETGESIKATLIQEAEQRSLRIMSFVDKIAQSYEIEGRRAAAEQWAQFKQDEDFAIFLDYLDTLREVLGSRTTYILDADQWLRFDFPEDAVRGVRPAGEGEGDE